MGNTANRLIKNTSWLYAQMGISMLISLITTRLVLNGLGASDFGVYGIVGGAIGMLGFLYSSMSSASQRFMNIAMGGGNDSEIKTVFNVCVVLHLFLSLLFTIVLVIAGFFFFNGILNIPKDRSTASIIVYGSLITSTAFSVMTVPYSAVMNAHENMKYFALIGILESFLKLTVALSIDFVSIDKLIFYGTLMACIPIINMIIMRIYCNRNYSECRIDLKRYYNFEVMKKITGFAGWNFLTSASSIISQYGMGIVINHFYGVLLNAAQSIANQVSGVLMTFSSNAMKALNPIIVKSEGANNRERVHYLTLLGCRFSFFIFAFFSLPLIALAPTVLEIWLKTIPEWAIIFCRLQLVRILLDQLLISLSSAIFAQGNIKYYTIWKALFNLLPIFITPIFFYFHFSPTVLYYIWILCWNIVGGIVTIYYVWKQVNLYPLVFVKIVVAPAFFTILSFFIPYFINYLGVDINQYLLCGISAVLFVVSSWFLLFEINERVIIYRFMKSFF